MMLAWHCVAGYFVAIAQHNATGNKLSKSNTYINICWYEGMLIKIVIIIKL